VERDAALARAAAEPVTTVFYEAANRLVRLLADLEARTGPDRCVMVGRELTKLHEELRAGRIEDVRRHFETVEPRGEITVVLEAAIASSPAAEGPDIAAEARRLLETGMRRSAVVRELVAAHGLPRNEVYRIVQELP
jgi:16S rRNA (cytidine1402-2'-O)-methyltransferase